MWVSRAGLAALALFSARGFAQDEALLNATYEYIIIGGGTAGLTIANRLTEEGGISKKSVLVIEYGPLSDDPSILIPFETLNRHPSQMYNITAAPIPGLANRTPRVPAGAVVGGGSAVNGMFFDRASAADYDAWEALGNAGWGWSGLLSYFKKSVTFNPPQGDIAEKYNYSWDVASAYGENSSGPVQLSFPPFGWESTKAGWEAWKQMGVERRKEGAGGEGTGAYSVPSALDARTRTRSYARTAHYEPFRNRSNYHLLTGYLATEIRFVSNLRAVGVNVIKRGTDGPKIAIQAHREVIVAAGAIWTPWLLQRSGLGPKTVLEAAGIPVLKDFPGVGANFQDHPISYTSSSYTNDTYPNPRTLFNDAEYFAEAEREYQENRTGPLTISQGSQGAFLPLRTVQPQWEDIIRIMLSQTASHYLPSTYDKNLTDGFLAQRNVTASLFNGTKAAAFEYGFGPGPLGGGVLLRSLSRGTVNIDASNPLGPPIVNYNTLSNPIDTANVIAMLKYSRLYNSQPALKHLGPVELIPGPNITSDADIERVLRESVLSPTFAHASGTAAMLPEELGGVVRNDLRVWGTRRLSVVDASVFPLIPAAHLCTTVYAVAEKAADLIKDRTDW